MADGNHDNQSIVIVNGSSMTQTGWAGDDAPVTIFPTVAGRSRSWNFGIIVGMAQKRTYIGDEAMAKRGILSLLYPMKYGIVKEAIPYYGYGVSWDWMEEIWHHIFHYELHVDPKEHSLLITESVFNTKQNKEKMTQILMEQFNIKKLCIANTALLSLFAAGKTTGTVLESGGSVTNIVPIYEGQCIVENMQSLHLGGDDLTTYLIKLFQKCNYSFTTTSEKEIVGEIKEKHMFLAIDYNTELQKAQNVNKNEIKYELPDGEIINIHSSIQIECTEPMFDPNLLDDGIERQSDGIHKLLYQSVNKCDNNIQGELFENIILSGGNTLFPNFDKRLEKEMSILVDKGILVDGYMKQYYSSYNTKRLLYKDIINLLKKYTSHKPNIIASKHRKYMPWVGGSMLSSLDGFDDFCLDSNDYDEYGPSIIHRKGNDPSITNND